VCSSDLLRLSIGCALAFMGMLILLPIANYLLPDLMARRVAGGFTISWFLLGIGFFPAVWVIAFIFIRRSIALEEAEVREARESQDGKRKEGGR
jgi:uncharacterized membrane protein (DUF485 family)